MSLPVVPVGAVSGSGSAAGVTMLALGGASFCATLDATFGALCGFAAGVSGFAATARLRLRLCREQAPQGAARRSSCPEW